MGNRLKKPVMVSELAAALGLGFSGRDCAFDSVASFAAAGEGALVFTRESGPSPAAQAPPAVAIAPPGASISAPATAVIEAANPRLAFCKALNWLCVHPGFDAPSEAARVHPEARVSPTAAIGKGVRIGRGTVIGHFVVIDDGVRIGEDCLIKSGAVIGEKGFGFERDHDGTPVALPQLGSVLIGDRVEIGSLSTVCRGALGDTVIGDDVKLDDHVHVAHNCAIGRGTLIAACAELSGGVQLGECCWVGPNASLLQQLRVGDGALVGIGAVVLRDAGAGVTVAGNPARVLRAS
jgi:UDP-3-O-[3-hydroxymyristoyl] glucosamine N-acyltransferase